MSSSFKSDSAMNSEGNERCTVLSGASGNDFTSDAQDGYSMRDAIA